MKRPIIPIILAVLLAIGAGIAVYAFARTADARAMESQQPVNVLVSTQVIPLGTSLQSAREAGLIVQETVPLKLAPSSAIEDVTAGNSTLVATFDIPAGQVLLAPSFASQLPLLKGLEVPDGQMALSVLLEAPAKVGPFLRPGSTIAVFDTVTVPDDGSGAATSSNPILQTRVLLDKVQVLAIGPVTEEQARSGQAGDWDQTLVTVAVTANQAEKLVHGAQTGALYLSLLGEGTSPRAGDGVTDTTVFN
jgi:pilus assembly protein CpaB